MKKLSLTNYKDFLIQNKYVVMKFTADWCGPCRQSKPMFEKLENNFKEISFVEIDIAEEPMIAAQFNVRAIPTTLIFKDGIFVSGGTGVPNLDKITNDLQNLIK